MLRIYSKNKGQVLLSVVVAVILALTLGLSVSSHTLSMASRVSRTDTSSRLTAAVEGGIERFLEIGDCLLEALTDEDNPDRYQNNCHLLGLRSESGIEGCIVDFPPRGADQISTRAIVTVEKFNYNSNKTKYRDHYRFTLGSGQLKEIPLYDHAGKYEGDVIEVCWDNDQTAVYFNAYDELGMMSQGGFYPLAFTDPLDTMQGFRQANAELRDNYSWCAAISLTELTKDKVYGLRIRAMYDNANFGVYPVLQDLAVQGYKIISVSDLVDESDQRVVKTLAVYKSYPYMPDVMDYSFFSEE